MSFGVGPRPGPLGRFTVVDLTRVRAGPTAVRQLADWGADVIQIETPEPGDGYGGPRHGSDFQNLHRGKRSLCLNLKTSRGIEILKQLVARADVLVENYRPDVKQRLGIGYEALKVVNPRLVYASISGFGQTGPYALRPGFDQVAQGMGGIMSVTGLPGQGPVRAGIPVADLSAGLFCAYGILLALIERETSGEGQWVSASLLEAQIAMMDFQAARWLIDGVVPGQAGNDHPSIAPMGTFRTGDGHINIASAGDVMWRKLCAAVGLDALADDPEFADDAQRTRNRGRLNALLNEALSAHASAHWIERLNEAGVPCGPIYRMDEVFTDPQVEHQQMARSLFHPILGDIQVVGQPVSLSRTPSRIAAAAPEKGQHSTDILESLGYAPDQIDDLKRSGVV
ncbi:CaiB/BaiF CoA transferase family protein [Chelatococcus reniformis]|uniref:CoA transferase n=1 Tax=Chelatococcus reniformis TaxID=1494448 RepID=A0A916UV65_9HYPH|nr:CoA transferase [Chelatococcus reniformis]GGC89266.1 CoA transferase [Chelatococcus reniformis]